MTMAESVTLRVEDLLAERTWLVSLSRHLVLDASEAEDIAQETLVRALRQSEVAAPGRLRGWLAATARNVAFERYRRSNQRSHLEQEVAIAEEEGSVTPEEAVARLEFRAQLAQLVTELPDDEQTAIALRYFEGLKTVAIAERTGVQPGTVRQRISRGVAKLRSALNQGDTEVGAPRWLAVATGIAGSGAKRSSSVGAAGSGTAAAIMWCAGLAALGAATLWLAGVFKAPGSPGTISSNNGDAGASPSPNIAPETLAPSVAAIPVPTAERIPAAAAWGPSHGKAWVQIVDEATGDPAEGVRWILSPTGDKDTGGLVIFSTETENPDPYAVGITGPNGIAEFTAPGDEVVQLITRRSERYARASHALRLEGGQALPQTVAVNTGTTVTGRVVDDLGHPCEGIHIAITGRDYEFAYATSTDQHGRYQVPCVADFPRRFKNDGASNLVPMDTDDCCLNFSWPLDWTPNPSSNDIPVAAYRRVLIGGQQGGHSKLSDVVLPRPKRILGRVINANGRPEAGALVTLNPLFRFSMRGLGGRQVEAGFPWEPRGKLVGREVLTDEVGEFEMLLTFEPSRRNSIGAINHADSKVTMRLPNLAPGETSERITLQLPDSSALSLQLTDATAPGGSLDWFRSFSPHLAQLTVHTPAGETPRGPASSFLPVNDKGAVYILGSALGRVPATITLNVTGFEPVELVIPRVSGTMGCALTRKPLIDIEVNVVGQTTTPWVKLKLSPFPPTKPVIDGRIESYAREIGYEPGAYFVEKAPVGATTTMPDPGGDALWVYAQLEEIVGEPIYPAEVRGPFKRNAGPLRITIEGVRRASTIHRSDASPSKKRTRTEILVQATSSTTGEHLKEAVLHCTSDRVRGGEQDNGYLKVYVSSEQASFVVEAVGYRPVRYGPLRLEAGGTLDLGVAQLEPLLKKSGQLLTAQGIPLLESRRIRYEDAELGWLSIESDDAGQFSLGTTGTVPVDCYVQGPPPTLVGNVPRHDRSEVRVPLEESVRGSEVTAQVPDWIDVEFEITGIETGSNLRRGELSVVNPEGQAISLGYLGLRSGKSLFGAALPPGTWNLRGGKRFTIKAQPFQLGPQATAAPVVIQGAGERSP